VFRYCSQPPDGLWYEQCDNPLEIRKGSRRRKALNESGVWKIGVFRLISRYISEIVQNRTKITILTSNRKSHTRFRLVPKRKTLDDLERPVLHKTLLFRSPPRKAAWRQTHPHCQQKQVKDSSLWQYKVYANIREGSLERGRQTTVGLLVIFSDFAGNIFGIFRNKDNIIILYGDIESIVGFPLIPKYLTLNGLEWLFHVFAPVGYAMLLYDTLRYINILYPIRPDHTRVNYLFCLPAEPALPVVFLLLQTTDNRVQLTNFLLQRLWTNRQSTVKAGCKISKKDF